MNYKKIFILGVFLIILVSGCTSKPTYSGDNGTSTQNINTDSSNENATVKEVATLDIWTASMKNWDSDAKADGIEVTIAPRDRDDKIVKVEGLVNARAYNREFDSTEIEWVKGDLFQEWNNIEVGQEYGILGTTLRLEFDKEIEKDEQLWLEVDFVYNGQTYSAIKDTVFNFSS